MAAIITGIDLYWLPLGAGGHSVRLNGRIFEWVAARLELRDRCDLYHSALEVRVPEARFVIEMAPVGLSDGAERGVVAEGAVGVRAAGRFPLFRYEVRRWRDGTIPDVDEAVDSPRRLSDNPECARRAARRRDVELELADLVANRAQRARFRVDPTATRRTSPRLAGRHRNGAPPAGITRSFSARSAGAAHQRVVGAVTLAPVLT